MMKNSYMLEDVVIDLWMMLDNIDTIGDMTKGNYEAFFVGAMKQVEKSKKYFELVGSLIHDKEPKDDE